MCPLFLSILISFSTPHTHIYRALPAAAAGWALQFAGLRDPAALAAHTSRLHPRFTAGDQQRRTGGEKKSFARPFYFSIENELDVESGAPKTVHHPPPTKKKKIEIKSKERKKLEGYDLIYVRLFMGCWMAKWKGGGTTTNPTVITSSPLVGHS